MKGRKSVVPAEPEEARLWRKYAEPFNKHLAERTKRSIWLDNALVMKVEPNQPKRRQRA